MQGIPDADKQIDAALSSHGVQIAGAGAGGAAGAAGAVVRVVGVPPKSPGRDRSGPLNAAASAPPAEVTSGSVVTGAPPLLAGSTSSSSTSSAPAPAPAPSSLFGQPRLRPISPQGPPPCLAVATGVLYPRQRVVVAVLLKPPYSVALLPP